MKRFLRLLTRGILMFGLGMSLILSSCPSPTSGFTGEIELQEGGIELDFTSQSIVLSFSNDVADFDGQKILLFNEGVQVDSSEYEISGDQDKIRIKLKAEINPGDNYTVELLPGAVTGVDGAKNSVPDENVSILIPDIVIRDIAVERANNSISLTFNSVLSAKDDTKISIEKNGTTLNSSEYSIDSDVTGNSLVFTMSNALGANDIFNISFQEKALTSSSAQDAVSIPFESGSIDTTAAALQSGSEALAIDLKTNQFMVNLNMAISSMDAAKIQIYKLALGEEGEGKLVSDTEYSTPVLSSDKKSLDITFDAAYTFVEGDQYRVALLERALEALYGIESVQQTSDYEVITFNPVLFSEDLLFENNILSVRFDKELDSVDKIMTELYKTASGSAEIKLNAATDYSVDIREEDRSIVDITLSSSPSDDDSYRVRFLAGALTAANGRINEELESSSFTYTLTDVAIVPNKNSVTTRVDTSIMDITFTKDPADATGTFTANLPSGLNIDENTGMISGVPNTVASGVYTVSFKGTGEYANAVSEVEIISTEIPVSGLDITQKNTVMTVQSALSPEIVFTPTPSTATGNYTIHSGSLPNGLSFNDNSISGTPTAITNGEMEIQVKFTATGKYSGEQIVTLSIAVNPIPVTGFKSTGSVLISANNKLEASPVTYTLEPSNATGSYSIEPDLTSDTGLSFNTSTGAITGTATMLKTATDYTVTFVGNGDYTGTMSETVSVTVNPISVTIQHNAALSPFSFIQNVDSLSIPFSKTPAEATGTFSVTSLPSGLSIDTNTGTISGQPDTMTESATYNVTFTGTGLYSGTSTNVTFDVIGVGSYSQGGVVFRIDGSSAYIMSLLVEKAPWGGDGTEAIAGADERILGSGQQNTQDILAAYPDEYTAASVANDYSVIVDGFTYNDWFLGSRDEMIAFRSVREIVNTVFAIYGGNLTSSSEWMWTSTEYNESRAYRLSSGTYSTSKLSAIIVRPIRKYN